MFLFSIAVPCRSIEDICQAVKKFVCCIENLSSKDLSKCISRPERREHPTA